MFIWIKSLVADMSAGTLLVAASMAMVVALLIALGEIASLQPDSDVLLGSGSHTDNASLLQMGASSADASGGSSRGSVSVMVPVGSLR